MSREEEQVIVLVRSITALACCPLCTAASESIHSHSLRTVADRELMQERTPDNWESPHGLPTPRFDVLLAGAGDQTRLKFRFATSRMPTISGADLVALTRLLATDVPVPAHLVDKYVFDDIHLPCSSDNETDNEA
jgi:hypothetical protein